MPPGTGIAIRSRSDSLRSSAERISFGLTPGHTVCTIAWTVALVAGAVEVLVTDACSSDAGVSGGLGRPLASSQAGVQSGSVAQLAGTTGASGFPNRTVTLTASPT